MPPDGLDSATPAAIQANTEKKTMEVHPMHVVMLGGSIIAAGTAVTGVLTYRSGAKSLAQDGINPATRTQFMPMAIKALALSSVLTGCLGCLGFYVLKENGFFRTDRAELPTTREVARLLSHPRAFARELAAADREAR